MNDRNIFIEALKSIKTETMDYNAIISYRECQFTEKIALMMRLISEFSYMDWYCHLVISTNKHAKRFMSLMNKMQGKFD